MDIKKADFAGSWYPDSLSGCEMEIRGFLSDPGFKDVPEKNRVAGIVPHAGWYFSGALACQVIRNLAVSDKPDVIVLYGKHMSPRERPDIMTRGWFETPMGPVPVHQELAASLAEALDLQKLDPSQVGPENTIELQLPFIRYFFPGTPVVTLGVAPNATAAHIGKETVNIARRLGLSLKIIGSTDLTHYGPNYGFTPRGQGAAAVTWVKQENDSRIIDRMLAMDTDHLVEEALSHGNACCAGAVAAAVSAAGTLGADHGELLAYTTSYDKSPGHSFVGYAAVLY